MTSYAERRYRPLVATLDRQSLEGFRLSDNVTVVGYFDPHDSKITTLFADIAKKDLDFYSFGIIGDPTAAKAEGVKQPSLILYKQFDEGRAIYDGVLEEDAIRTFIDEAATPLIGELELKYSHRYFGEVSRCYWQR